MYNRTCLVVLYLDRSLKSAKKEKNKRTLNAKRKVEGAVNYDALWFDKNIMLNNTNHKVKKADKYQWAPIFWSEKQMFVYYFPDYAMSAFGTLDFSTLYSE